MLSPKKKKLGKEDTLTLKYEIVQTIYVGIDSVPFKKKIILEWMGQHPLATINVIWKV